MKRNVRMLLAVTLVAALVLAVSPIAVATAMPAARRMPPQPLYKVSVPHVAHDVVMVGESFDVTGSVAPTITAGDDATVVLKVFSVPGCAQVASVAATLTDPVGRGTGWTASLSLPTGGTFSLFAVVVKGGVVVGRSPARCMVAKFPYHATIPRVDHSVVKVGDTFEASGSVVPTITPDDTSTTVAIQVLRLGDGCPRELFRVPATLTGPSGRGTGYSASLSLPKAGEFALVALVLKGGNVVGHSERRPMIAVLPYKVSKPRVLESHVATGTAFDATGSVTPTITVDDNATIYIQVYRVRPRGACSQVTTVTGSFTGPVGKGTGYTGSVTLPKPGTYALVAVVMKGDMVVGRSEAKLVFAKCAAATVLRSKARAR